MPVQLMKLRGVPEDELADLTSLLDGAGLDWYETTAGNWGISLPALWLTDDSRLDEARALLDEYQQNRLRDSREEYARMKAQGRARGWLDIIRENPLRFLVYMGIVLLMIYVSTVPWFSMGADSG